MQSSLNKVGKIASETASRAGSKASELIEIGKLKGKISAEKRNINGAKKEIGEYCYELFETGDMKDETIKGICETIEASLAGIEDLERQIEKVKAEYKEKYNEDPVIEE